MGFITYAAGTRIFEQGDMSSEAYLIQQGYVEIAVYIDNQKTVIAVLGPGEIFGEIAAVDGDARSATAVAIHETVVTPISRNQISNAINNGDPLTQLLLQSAITWLRDVYKPIEVPQAERSKQKLNSTNQFQQTQDRVIDHINVVSKLKSAINKQQFQIYYQPIINLSSGMVAGFEALLRGPTNLPEFFSPTKFIPILESSRLVVPLGRWVLEKTLQSIQHFQKEAAKRGFKQPIFISVNVSPYQLEKKEDVEALARIIEASSVNSNHLKLEITESALLANPEQSTWALGLFRNTGAKIAIDDFGTGYSSLNYLHRFPLDTLKIDRSFINNLTMDENGERIVSAIIHLAHDLQMDIVAEGIEQESQLRWLSKKSCEYGQGFYMAKPAPMDQSIKLLQKAYF